MSAKVSTSKAEQRRLCASQIILFALAQKSKNMRFPKGTFSLFPVAIADGLPPLEQVLLAYLAKFSSKLGQTKITDERLRHHCGVKDVQSIRAARRSLISKNKVRAVKDGRCFLYTIIVGKIPTVEKNNSGENPHSIVGKIPTVNKSVDNLWITFSEKHENQPVGIKNLLTKTVVNSGENPHHSIVSRLYSSNGADAPKNFLDAAQEKKTLEERRAQRDKAIPHIAAIKAKLAAKKNDDKISSNGINEL